jgi:glyoxylase I family protein
MTREGENIAGREVPPPISKAHHVAFTVRDLEASIAWYRKVFNANLVDGDLVHYGRQWTGYARLVIEPRTGFAIGLHHNVGNSGAEFDEATTGLDHFSFQVERREDLEAWAAWLDGLEIAHSGIQSQTEPFVYSTVVFRDIDNIQLEFVAVGS